MNKICEHDKREIEKLKWFKEELMKQRERQKDMSYEELADITINIGMEKSMQITGGDVRKLTLMFCTQLASNRYSSITRDIAASVIRKYLDDLQESSPARRPVEQELSQEQISDKVKNELNS
jgi:hypothetical protein